MSEETPFRPCPMCGGRGYQNAYLVSTGMVACGGDCAIELPLDTWNALSDAAALARAVERLERGVDRVEFRQWIEGWGTRAWSAREEIAGPKGPRTFAAALIALAEEVEE